MLTCCINVKYISKRSGYYKEVDALKDSRLFNINTTDAIFWELTNYLNAKTKEDFDRILAKVKSKEEK